MEGTAGAAIARSAAADRTTTTAEDTVKQKSRASNIVSGGHLVAKADVKATAKPMPCFRSDVSPIHPYRVAWEMNHFLSDETVYVGDSAEAPFGAFAYARGRRSRRPTSPRSSASGLIRANMRIGPRPRRR